MNFHNKHTFSVQRAWYPHLDRDLEIFKDSATLLDWTFLHNGSYL